MKLRSAALNSQTQSQYSLTYIEPGKKELLNSWKTDLNPPRYPTRLCFQKASVRHHVAKSLFMVDQVILVHGWPGHPSFASPGQAVHFCLSTKYPPRSVQVTYPVPEGRWTDIACGQTKASTVRETKPFSAKSTQSRSSLDKHDTFIFNSERQSTGYCGRVKMGREALF